MNGLLAPWARFALTVLEKLFKTPNADGGVDGNGAGDDAVDDLETTEKEDGR